MMAMVAPIGAPSLTQSNQIGDIYLIGNDKVDGSIRICVAEGESLAHIERRAKGVWNATSFRFSAGFVELGRDLRIEAAASFLETFNEDIADKHQRALIPHIPFTTTGTSFFHTPILDSLNTDIIHSTAVSETIGTTIGILFTSDHARFIQSISHEVGTTGATDEVQYSVYSGTDNTGILIARQNLPSSDLVASSTLTVTFTSDIGLNDATDFYIELTSDTAFSLKTDSSGNPLMSVVEQHLDTLDIVTENLCLSNDLSITFSNDLEITYSNQF